MRGRTAIGINNDLTTREACVAIRSTDHKETGWVHIEFVFWAHPAIWKYFFHNRADKLANGCLIQAFIMLCRNHNRCGPHRLAIYIFQGHLALGVRSKAFHFAGMAKLSHALEDQVRIIDRCWHQYRGLFAGIAKHNALVTCALVFVASSVNALCDVCGLSMEVNGDVSIFPVESILLVANVFHGGARNFLNLLRCDVIRSANLSSQYNPIGCCQRLTGYA